jgi:hypothetical protein
MELLILNLDLKEIYLAGEWTSTGHLLEQMPTGDSLLNKIRGTE